MTGPGQLCCPARVDLGHGSLTYVCAWRAEQEMVERERAFLAARDNHRGIHNRLRELRGELDGVSSKYEREAAAANSALEAARKLE